MTNHPNRSKAARPYTLTFVGGALAKMPRHTREHATYEAASDEAGRVLSKLDNRAAHPAIIDGPGCGRDGTTIR
jgi:hypothetical protein